MLPEAENEPSGVAESFCGFGVPRNIFREFEDADPQLYFGSGDVKYHLGHSSDFVTGAGAKVHLSLCFNPSHLEYVNTVVLGRTRAKQDRVGDSERRSKLALLIHGDAAFAGEGVVQETLVLSQLQAFEQDLCVHAHIEEEVLIPKAQAMERSLRDHLNTLTPNN